MLIIAIQTLRSRLASFASALLALTLGTAVIATMGLIIASVVASPGKGAWRYAAVPIVVSPSNVLQLPDSTGALQSQPLAELPALSPSLIAKVSAVSTVVEDRTFYAQIFQPGVAIGPKSQIGRPWSAAAFTPYKLAAGTSPNADNQIVISGAPSNLIGQHVTVLTASCPPDRSSQSSCSQSYTVVGITASIPHEPAIFFSDAEAARISPRVDALGVYGSFDAVRSAVGNAAQVLTGDSRSKADPQYNSDIYELNSLESLLGVAAAVSGCISIFVVATTFSFAVTQRRRELALLRLAGATARQVRQMVIIEAVLVGTFASLVGCALGIVISPILLNWMTTQQLAPIWITVRFSRGSLIALAVTLAIGLLVAISSAAFASIQASKIKPLQALSEATIERRSFALLRVIVGLVCIAAAVLEIFIAGIYVPTAVVDLKSFVFIVLLLLTGVVLMTPAIVRPMTRLATLPFRSFSGVSPMLVRENALIAVKQTTSTVVPILITAGLAASILGAAASIDRAGVSELQSQLSNADFVVTPASTPGINQSVLNQVNAIDGIETVTARSTTIFAAAGGSKFLNGDIPALPYSAQEVDPDFLASTLHLPVVEGSVSDLSDQSIIVNQSWHEHVGDVVHIWRADGSPVALRISAVLKTGTALNSVFVTPSNGGTGLPLEMYVKVRPGFDRAVIATTLASATNGLGVKVVPVTAWTAHASADTAKQTRMGLLMIIGVAVAYSGLSIANVMAMSAVGRARSIAILRLAGATRLQALWVIAGETLLVVCIGLLLAAGMSTLALFGLDFALRHIVSSAAIVIPWNVVGVLTAVCAITALLASLLPASLSMRVRPIEFAKAE